MLILSVLALGQPIFGFAASLAWFSFLLVAIAASVTLVAVNRKRARSVPIQAAAWSAAYAIAGLLYAALSFGLGYLVDERSGFQIYGTVWLFNLVPLVIYLSVSVGVARRPHRQRTPA